MFIALTHNLSPPRTIAVNATEIAYVEPHDDVPKFSRVVLKRNGMIFIVQESVDEIGSRIYEALNVQSETGPLADLAACVRDAPD